jgi:hypothetical protein
VENNSIPENRSNSSRQDLSVPIMILAFLVCSWLVYAYANRNWFDAFDQVLAWLKNPIINYTSVPIAGVPLAFLATLEVLFLGATSGYLLLNNEKDFGVKMITVVGLGFGLTGLITIILGIAGDLYVLPLNAAILLLSSVCLVGILYQKKIREKRSFREILTPHFNFKVPGNRKFWVPVAAGIVVLFFFAFYHALLTVIVHWDATVYHAAMAVIMYNDHSIPVIAGPSIGIEMSANFPPLFSSLGAFYYIQIGSVEDFFLRAIPPVMGLLTVLSTYKLGEVIHSKKLGVMAALFLAATPLFFRYSIYATSYSTLTFFCTVAILFLFYGVVKGSNKYWIASGVFLGFAALTSYIALYLAPFFFLGLVYYFMKKKGTFKVNLKKAAILLITTIIIGGVWYARNEIAVGNPIYPNAYTVLGGVNIDPLIMNTTVNGIKLSAATSYFGVGNATVFDQVMTFITYRTSFPAISLFTVLALALIPFENKKFWLLAIWPLSLSALVLSGVSWGFPRHMVFAMPGFALLSALPIIKAFELCKVRDIQNMGSKVKGLKRHLGFIRKTNFLRLGIVVILLVAFLFPSLTLIMGGKVYEENLADQVPKDYLWFLEHPNADTWTVLNRIYPEAQAWKYINANLTQGQKVGTVENRIYYVKNCSNDYFFYLDGWEARDLYNITDPALAMQFLRDNNVTIIVDVLWAREHGHFNILPMAKYLGVSPFFPTLYNNNSNPAIYNVGPLKSPLTDNSTGLVSISQAGWGEVRAVKGVNTQAVLAENDSTKLYVATPYLTSVNMTYLDVGNDPVSVNIHDLATQNWTNGYATIDRTNTGQWKNYTFIIPTNENGYTEIGLHAFGENLTVSSINATSYQSQIQQRPILSTINGTIVNGTLSMNLTKTTLPETLMFYLPIPNGTKTVNIQTNSYGKQTGIEIYDGFIQPMVTTDWWIHYDLTARSPTSIVYGTLNPSIIWHPEKSGYYTVVVVLREYWKDDPRMDLTVSTLVSINSTVTAQSAGLGINGNT